MDKEISHGGSRAWLAWICSVAFVVYYFVIQNCYAIVNPTFQADLGISAAQVGVVAATYSWVFAFAQFFSGALFDRVGARAVLLPAIALVSCGCFLFSRADDITTLFAAQFVIALGASAGFVGAGYVGASWFGSAKFSPMFGLVQFSAALAAAFSQNGIAWSLHYFSWKQLFTFFGLSGGTLFLSALFLLHDNRPSAHPPIPRIANLAKSLVKDIFEASRVKHIWVCAFVGGLLFGSLLSMGMVWAPKILALRGMDQSLIAFASSLIWLGLAAGCLLIPHISDRIRRRKSPMVAAALVQCISFLGLLYLLQLGMGVLMILCFCFGLGAAAHMLAFSSAADVIDAKRLGSATALVNGVMFLLGGFFIACSGAIFDSASRVGVASSIETARCAALPLLAGLITALVLLIFMKESYPAKTRRGH